MHSIQNLSFDELIRLHKAKAITIRANMKEAVRILANDPRVPGRYKSALLIHNLLALGLVAAGIALWIWVKWWAGLIPLWFAWAALKTKGQTAGQTLCDLVLINESLYKDCLSKSILLITENKAPLR